jgi:hypothetical protein
MKLGLTSSEGETTDGLRELHIEMIRNLYCTPDRTIIKMIKYMKMRWVEDAAW